MRNLPQKGVTEADAAKSRLFFQDMFFLLPLSQQDPWEYFHSWLRIFSIKLCYLSLVCEAAFMPEQRQAACCNGEYPRLLERS